MYMACITFFVQGLGPPPASMNKNYVSRATPNARWNSAGR